MANPYLGELRLVAFNFAPNGWAQAAGQILSISQNTALFALLGTTYGGNGSSTFGLPNLQGNLTVGFGQLPGGQNYALGDVGGTPTETLLVNVVPGHTHTLNASTGKGGNTPVNSAFGEAETSVGSVYYNGTNPPLTNMSSLAVSIMGGNQPHQNLMPYLVLYWVIALQGVFPPRG